jgi:hypothetical protein
MFLSLSPDLQSSGSLDYSRSSDNKFAYARSSAGVTDQVERTLAVYRDPGAWYHLLFLADSSGGATNTHVWYINGVLAPDTDSYANTPSRFLTPGYANYVGGDTPGGRFFEGYLSDFFAAERLLSPTDFGYFDASGVWVPKAFSTAKANVIAAGGFGTQGFALEFKSSNFNSGTLVWADQSGNGNDFTASWNCQVGAGGGTTGTDILSDSPATNYAVINPLYNGASTSRANLTTANTTGKPSILPAFANTGIVPQTVGVNGAGVSWNGTEAGWASTGNISFGQQSTFATATGLSAVKLNAATVPNGETGFQAVLDTGANILTTAQATFPNGLWWVKDRVNANENQLVDIVNGSSNALQTPASGASTAYVAPTGNSVAWAWNAPEAWSSPGSPPGTAPSSGRRSLSTGFSIVSYTGNTTNFGGLLNVAHGLNQAPDLMIIKNRSTAATSFVVYHSAIPSPANGGLRLNLSNAFVTFNGYFNDTPPSNSLIALGPDNQTNGNGNSMTAYCWAAVPGYSAFGSYVGNGSTNGPFVYTGFKTAFVLIKCSSTTGNWEIYDNARNTYNPETLALQPNLTNAESTIDGIDFLSNGFKIRTTDANFNTSGQTYIYAAFAENPFGGSNVAPVTAR